MVFNPGNMYTYTAFELKRAAFYPVNIMAEIGKHLFENPLNPIAYTDIGRNLRASMELLERMTRHYIKPEWDLDETLVEGHGDKPHAIKARAISRRTFCNLIHFEKQGCEAQPKMLIVAPMSGHFATLLRGTVEGLLPYYDVYITDWTNANEIPLSKGNFDLDDYIDYVADYMRLIHKRTGKRTHVMAVCQPAIPVMCATALMGTAKDESAPLTMTLIGGPIDTRKNPTAVNQLAERRSLDWFKNNVIVTVPANYPGFMRKVYPGFIQLSGFMQMNLDRHIEAHQDLFNFLVEGDGESAEAHRKFYNEYLSVTDVCAEYYIMTIDKVFQKRDLANRKFISRERPVITDDIKNTAVLTIEGEKDDISGKGQTKAALDLCGGLPDDKKKHHLQKEVGHYGLFNGRRFREGIIPVIREFTRQHNGEKATAPAAKKVS